MSRIQDVYIHSNSNNISKHQILCESKILLKGDKVIKNQTKSCLNIAFVTFLQLLL